MNARQFFDRVAYLRQLQKQYFKTRDKTVLSQALAVEKEVDDEIARVQSFLQIDKQIQDKNLFNQ